MRPFDPVIIAVVIGLIIFYIYRHVKHYRGHAADNQGE
jgi:hypothetical protein